MPQCGDRLWREDACSLQPALSAGDLLRVSPHRRRFYYCDASPRDCRSEKQGRIFLCIFTCCIVLFTDYTQSVTVNNSVVSTLQLHTGREWLEMKILSLFVNILTPKEKKSKNPFFKQQQGEKYWFTSETFLLNKNEWICPELCLAAEYTAFAGDGTPVLHYSTVIQLQPFYFWYAANTYSQWTQLTRLIHEGSRETLYWCLNFKFRKKKKCWGRSSSHEFCPTWTD